MNEETIRRLCQINRDFYSRAAAPFSGTRSGPSRDLEGIVPYIPHGARVLDAGCGNGRAGILLARLRPDVTYLGLDASPDLLRLASAGWTGAPFLLADLMQPGWADLVRERAGGAGWDCVLLLAVLHHIPGGENRARILAEARGLLSPGGRVVASSWQFMQRERQRRKIVPWARAEIDERELEPGDALLSWQGEEGVRYCHWMGPDEMQALAGQAGLRVTATWRAGGREGDLSLYAVMEL